MVWRRTVDGSWHQSAEMDAEMHPLLVDTLLRAASDVDMVLDMKSVDWSAMVMVLAQVTMNEQAIL